MWNEHFGIAIVESMAAGLIMVAHNSGGPKSDIVLESNHDPTKRTGYLATTADEYANRIHEILSMKSHDAAVIRQNARVSAQRFSDEVFTISFQNAVAELQLFI